MLLEITYSTGKDGRSTVIYGNGVEGHLVHDDHDRLIRIEYQKGGVLLDSCRLRYDENGHRALVQYLGAPTRNVVHAFDGAGRLVEARTGFPLAPLPDVAAPSVEASDVAAARVAAAAAPGIAYILDDADARSEDKGFNGGAIGEKYILGSDHRVAAAGTNTISYNLDGHRTMDARYIYELDALNRVSRVRDRVTNAILVEQEYDALSRVAAGSMDGQQFERWFAGSTQIHEYIRCCSRKCSPAFGASIVAVTLLCRRCDGSCFHSSGRRLVDDVRHQRGRHGAGTPSVRCLR